MSLNSSFIFDEAYKYTFNKTKSIIVATPNDVS